MAKKKKSESIGVIKGIDLVKQSKPIQDIPFRTGVYQDKRKKREKINRNNIDKYLWLWYNIIERRKKNDWIR